MQFHISVSTCLCCPSVRLPTKERSGTHAAPFVSVSLSFFFLHFSVIRFGRRKLAPAALARVPGARASDVLASHTCQHYQQQNTNIYLSGLNFVANHETLPVLFLTISFEVCFRYHGSRLPEEANQLVAARECNCYVKPPSTQMQMAGVWAPSIHFVLGCEGDRDVK